MPISSLFGKGRMLAQILHGLMLNNEQPARQQQGFIKYNSWYFRKAVQVIRRICKYQVKLFRLVTQVFKNVFFKHLDIGEAMFGRGFFDIIDAMNAPIHRNYFLCIPRSKFQRDISRAAEKVEHPDSFKFDLVLQDVK